MELAFFGLASNYRGTLYDQIFDMMYYGKDMKWSWTELYNLPTFLRIYFYKKLADIRKKEYEAEKAAYDKAKSGKR